MPNLLKLTAAHNNLRKIDDEFCEKASNLQYLDFSNNNLILSQHTTKLMTSDFADCRRLVQLNLSYNNITKFPFFREDEHKNQLNTQRSVLLEYTSISEIDVIKKNFFLQDYLLLLH